MELFSDAWPTEPCGNATHTALYRAEKAIIAAKGRDYLESLYGSYSGSNMPFGKLQFLKSKESEILSRSTKPKPAPATAHAHAPVKAAPAPGHLDILGNLVFESKDEEARRYYATNAAAIERERAEAIKGLQTQLTAVSPFDSETKLMIAKAVNFLTHLGTGTFQEFGAVLAEIEDPNERASYYAKHEAKFFRKL